MWQNYIALDSGRGDEKKNHSGKIKDKRLLGLERPQRIQIDDREVTFDTFPLKIGKLYLKLKVSSS